MNYLEVTVVTNEEIYETIADLFWELGAGGVVIEDPKVILRHIEEGAWEAWNIPKEMLETEEFLVKGYFPVDEALDETMQVFRQKIDEFRNVFPGGRIEVRENEVASENWASAWKAYYKPEKIGERVVIKPSWEEYQAKPGEVVVELDPGMAFGTGNHPTTAMCIRALEKVIVPGNTVLDVGTGSGVLAITAAKLGAKQVLAVDNDLVSIDAARENTVTNRVSDIITVTFGDLASGITEKFNVVVANIIAAVILKLLPQAEHVTAENGFFIGSGIIRDRLPDIVEAMEKSAFELETIIQEGEWAAVVSRRR